MASPRGSELSDEFVLSQMKLKANKLDVEHVL